MYFFIVLFAITIPSGTITLILSLYQSRKLKFLKKNGIEYSAKINYLYKTIKTDIVMIRLGTLSDTYICCEYINEKGKGCIVKSHRFLWNRTDYANMKAKVYVDKYKPHKYAVELFIDEESAF